MSFDNRSSALDESGSASSSSAQPEMQPATLLCKADCGFYANAAFDGMCSKCFRECATRATGGLQSGSGAVGQSGVVGQSGATTPVIAEGITTHSLGIQMGAVSAISQSVSSPDTVHDNQSIADDNFSPTPGVVMATSLETGAPTVFAGSRPTSERESAHFCTENNNSVAVAAEVAATSSGKEEKPKRNRCLTCKKRVGLMGFECRCGGLFCSVHRYSDMHACAFDYREHGQAQIRRANPLCVGEKIQKL